MSEIDRQKIKEIIQKKLALSYNPASVYRVQFNHTFTFEQARQIVPYLESLGIDALYGSPYFQAVKGSMHGYDVTNPNTLNPEIGGEEVYQKLIETLRRHSMGHVMDVVPNHMGISDNHNAWWMDVLEYGQNSPFAEFFDIDWKPKKVELKNKVLLPVLGDQYGKVLENQELKLVYRNGQFFIEYWDHSYPVAPETYPKVLEYKIEELKKHTAGHHEELLEYLSIISGFHTTEPRGGLVEEKENSQTREKDRLKQKLKSLYDRSEPVRAFVDSRIRIFNGKVGDSSSFDLLDELLQIQYYRLSYWRVASHEINYRRFFHINELAAIRVEDPRVFDACHWLIFRLIMEGKVQGLRIDHPDGLWDPAEYFRTLQRKYLLQVVVKEILPDWDNRRPVDRQWMESLENEIESVLMELGEKNATPLFVIVEKILDRKESLPEDWNVKGTVGYDFLNSLNGLFINQDNGSAFTEIYEKFTGAVIDFEQLVYDKKKLFAAFDMASELNTLGFYLDQLSEHNRYYRDFTLNDLVTAIREIIACFPIYRTYITSTTDKVSERDEKYIMIAVEKAKGRHVALSPTVFDFIKDVLTLKFNPAMEESKHLYRNFILKFQQLAAPIMAKGLEDTAFYIYNRFISLNEVGGDPEHFGVSKGDFHRIMQERHRKWPLSFLTSSTHDTKRSEDVRMRLNVLSEIPKEWNFEVSKWTRINKKHKVFVRDLLSPSKNAEYFIYQTLIGVWPDHDFKNPVEYETFKERVWECILKSIREAKLNTNWLNPNEAYEDVVKKFVYALLDKRKRNSFLKSFTVFQKKVSFFGKLNALSALTLKLASPGVVDTYQGNELWDYSLVDPDNRRPVNFERRRQFLEEFQEAGDFKKLNLRETDSDGRLKLYLLSKMLNFRKQQKEIFLDGDYIALEVQGEREKNIVAFIRKHEAGSVLAVASRFFTELFGFNAEPELNDQLWGDTCLILPKEFEKGTFENVYTGKSTPFKSNKIEVKDLLVELKSGVFKIKR